MFCRVFFLLLQRSLVHLYCLPCFIVVFVILNATQGEDEDEAEDEYTEAEHR
jgi:hypothetical protein